MGFSPADFTCRVQGRVHWELKDHKIVLWNDQESKAILDLDFNQATEASNQLALLVEMSEAPLR